MAYDNRIMTQLSIFPNARVSYEIIRETADYLVVYKPAGLATQPGKSHMKDTLLNGVFNRFGPQLQNLGKRRDFGLLHRLDLATSGLVLVGLSIDGYDALRAQFESRTIKKRYLACVHGHLSQKLSIKKPIREVRRKGEKWAQVGPHPNAQPAHTEVEPKFSRGGLSLVDCHLITGRLHQIRIHLASEGLPVIGDRKYGGTRPTPPGFGPRAIGLHAYRLAFRAPSTGKRVVVQCPMPPNMEVLARHMGFTLR